MVSVLDDIIKEMCLHQFIRPEYHHINMKIEGVGDCYICKPDYDNINCRKYYPIKVMVYEIIEKVGT